MSRHPKFRASSSKREYLKFLGVILVVVAMATLMSTLIKFTWYDWLRWSLGGLLLLFGGFKLIGFEMFQEAYPRYNPLAAKYDWYAYVFAVFEVLLGIFYILNMAASLRDLTTFFIMAVGLYGAYQGLQQRGPTYHSVCLGNVLRLPLSTVLLFESFLGLVMCIAIITIGM